MPQSVKLPAKTPRPVTGRTVLYWLLGFFGIVALMNGIMIYTALTTFRGVQLPNAYEKGVKYEQRIIAAEEQRKLGWKVDVTVGKNDKGERAFTVSALDKDGAPLHNLTIDARLQHPTDEAGDQPVTIVESGPGLFKGIAPTAHDGQWTLMFDLSQNGEKLYHEESRVLFAPGQ